MAELITQIVVGGGSCVSIILLYFYADDLGNMNIEKMENKNMPRLNDTVRERLFTRAKSINPVLGGPWQNDMNLSLADLAHEVETVKALKLELDSYVQLCSDSFEKAQTNDHC